jgi:hypothetical protein
MKLQRKAVKSLLYPTIEKESPDRLKQGKFVIWNNTQCCVQEELEENKNKDEKTTM